MEKLIKFLNGRPVHVKVLVLIALCILVYFISGCGFKADKVYFENPDLNFGKDRSSLWMRQQAR